MGSPLLFLCFLVVGTTLGQQYGRTRFVNGMLSNIGNVANQGLDLTNEGVKLTTKLTGSGVQYGTDLGKMGLAAGASLTSQGLGGGTELGKQGLELVDTVADLIPGAGMPLKLVTGLGKWGLNLGNSVGQKGIKTTSDLGNVGLDYANKMTQLTTGTVANLASAGTGITKDALSSTFNLLGNIFNTGMDSANQLIPGGGSALENPQLIDVPETNPELIDVQPVPEPEPDSEIINAKSAPESKGLTSYLEGFFG